MDPCTPRDAVDKGLSAFLLQGPVWGICLFKSDGLSAPGAMDALQAAWAAAEGGIAFRPPRVDVTRVSGSAGSAGLR